MKSHAQYKALIADCSTWQETNWTGNHNPHSSSWCRDTELKQSSWP